MDRPQEPPDCICVQEVKAQAADVQLAVSSIWPGLTGYFHFAQKKGYSGVAAYSRDVAQRGGGRLTVRRVRHRGPLSRAAL
jgi:exonuclease III